VPSAYSLVPSLIAALCLLRKIVLFQTNLGIINALTRERIQNSEVRRYILEQVFVFFWLLTPGYLLNATDN